jgi:hypothetical protein
LESAFFDVARLNLFFLWFDYPRKNKQTNQQTRKRAAATISSSDWPANKKKSTGRRLATWKQK